MFATSDAHFIHLILNVHPFSKFIENTGRQKWDNYLKRYFIENTLCSLQCYHIFSISVDGDKHYINTFRIVDFMVVFLPRLKKQLSSLSLSTKSLTFLATSLVYTH